MQSDRVLHQSHSGEVDKEDKKEYKGELENKVMAVYVGVEVINTLCGIHVKVNTWVIHHP